MPFPARDFPNLIEVSSNLAAAALPSKATHSKLVVYRKFKAVEQGHRGQGGPTGDVPVNYLKLNLHPRVSFYSFWGFYAYFFFHSLRYGVSSSGEETVFY